MVKADQKTEGMMDGRRNMTNTSTNSIPKRTPTQHPHLVLLGKKLGMSQIFSEAGDVIPVTAIQVGPCIVVQKKTKAKEGYNAVQLGFDDKKAQNVTKPEAGHFKGSKAPAKRFIQEFRLDETSIREVEVGQNLDSSLLKIGDHIDVSGVSIGKGYQGVVKRYHFRGAPASRAAEFFRHGGSIGMRSIPGRVFKNKKMPGHMGDRNVTTQNITVVGIDTASNVVLVKGAVPGAKNAYVTLKSSMKGGFDKRSLKSAPAAATEEAKAE